MHFWHELDLRDWRKYEHPGDKYLPFRQYVRKFAEAQFECPPMEGRGIVICGGGRFLPGIWVTVNLLKDFGCKLPIELWHLGPDELPEPYPRLFAEQGIKCIDAFKVREKHPTMRLGGWQSKCYAILLSEFAEVLFLDGDNHPRADPTYLFDIPAYKETGAVFWPDRVSYSAEHTLWDVWGIEPKIRNLYPTLNDHYGPHCSWSHNPDNLHAIVQHETGQMLIDKRRCWHALQIAMHANEFSDFHYQHSWGDTAPYQFAFLTLGQPYHTIRQRLIEVPIERNVQSGNMGGEGENPYMREPGDIRATFLQRDDDGKIIFEHRSGGGGAQAAFKLSDEYDPAQRCNAACYPNEARALALLADLRSKLGDSFWVLMEAMHADRISPHRRNGMAAMFRLMEERKSKSIVETGTLRKEDNWHGDGGMTWWFGRYAKQRGGKLTTIDIDSQALAVARKVCTQDAEVIDFVESDSVVALKAGTEPIDVLYLDSFDYDVDAKRSQAHALNEIIAALPRLHEASIIGFDDCGFADGGKGGLAIPYLCASGWKLAHMDYVSVLVRG